MAHRRLAKLMLLVVMLPIAAMGTFASIAAAEQPPPIHYRQSANAPPGAIGHEQLLRGGPLPGYFQPIEITAPQGVQISMAVEGDFEEPQPAPRLSAVLIGPVYRFRVSSIPRNPGLEVYPTVEVINRLYPPLGMELKFPVQIDLTQEELVLASRGNMVTRIIYLEDPEQALPARQNNGRQSWFEAPEGEDPLRLADELGRPMAILRIGGMLPRAGQADEAFLYGSPPLLLFSNGTGCTAPEPVASPAPVPPSEKK
jgi:hypothetical protein